MQPLVIYPGTFDPITNGHYDIIKRARALFPKVIIAVADSTSKNPLFSLGERIELIRKTVKSLPDVDVIGFDNLLVEFAQSMGANLIIRGLRAVSDFEYELQLAHMNNHLVPSLETLFLPTTGKFSFISSRLIREIAKLGGDVEAFVPTMVVKALSLKFAGNL